MEEDRRGNGVRIITVRPVDYSGFFCEEVSFNRVPLTNFTISGSTEDGVSW